MFEFRDVATVIVRMINNVSGDQKCVTRYFMEMYLNVSSSDLLTETNEYSITSESSFLGVYVRVLMTSTSDDLKR